MSKPKRKLFESITHAILALSMLIMVVLVFLNVVLRYGFNSGIAESEDITRFIFIWMVFIGAILAMEEGAHLGTDILVKSLGPRSQKCCAIVSHILMFFAFSLLLYGSWSQAELNSGVVALGAVPYPLSWVYIAGVVASAGSLIVIVKNLWALTFGPSLNDKSTTNDEPREQVTPFFGQQS